MSDKLTLKLLGKPEILLNGEPVMIFHKAQALFYYLAVTGHAHERSTLLSLLWSKIEGSDAKNNLRVTLSHLRKQRLGDFLTINRHSVSFNYSSNYVLDVELLKNALRASPKTADYLEKTLQNYRGPFLEGFQVPEEKVFDQWVKQERQHVHNLIVQTLYNLSLRYQEQRNYTASIDATNRLLRLEPYHEDAQQMLMMLFNKTGQQSEAIAQYNLYAQQLKERREQVPSLQEIMDNRAQFLRNPYSIDPDARSGYGYGLIHHSERRQVTILHCRISDNKAESDPENWHSKREETITFLEEQASALRASIIQKNDSGVNLVFSCPQEFEDSDLWSVQAALNIQQKFTTSDLTDAVNLTMALHTGLAVVDFSGGELTTNVNVTGQVCEQVQDMACHADKGGIYLSPEIHTLVKNNFTTKAAGTMHKVLGVASMQNQLAAVSALPNGSLTELVNRQSELDTLWATWQAAQGDSAARFVFIHGEMGVGKSRLVHHFVEKLAADKTAKAVIIRAKAISFYQDQSLQPLISALQEQWSSNKTFAAATDGLADNVVQKLSAKNDAIDVSQDEISTGILTLLRNLASKHPVLLVIEDLQWADNATIAFLSSFLEKQDTGRMLTLVTARPDFRPSWPHYAHTTSLQLARLSVKDVATLVDSILKGVNLSEENRQKLLDYSDGIPLFAEALAVGIKDGKDFDHMMSNNFPATLYSALTMSLDNLPTAKRVAQLGSVLGREFRYDTIVNLWDKDEVALQEGLDLLVKAGVLYSRGQAPQVTYKFNYGLTQQIAYRSLRQKDIAAINKKR
jgi:DNA-binding SARP family transcriptional activator